MDSYRRRLILRIVAGKMQDYLALFAVDLKFILATGSAGTRRRRATYSPAWDGECQTPLDVTSTWLALFSASHCCLSASP